MESEKKKSFIARNIEWIALIILILAGLIAIWQYFYPGLFRS
jgi:predicted negative regulator of RcsB-dependent stress response